MSESRVLIGWRLSWAENFRHGPAQIDLDHVATQRLAVKVGQILRRIVLELLQEDAVARDLAEGLAIGRAGHAEPDRQRGAVARQPDHPHVVAEILTAELGADAERLGELVHLPFHLEVAEGVAVLGALRGQRIQIAAGRELHGLHGELGRGAADHDGQVIGRTGRGAQRQNLLLQEGEHAVVGEDRGRRLEQERLVGRAAALGDEQKFVSVVAARAVRIDLDLRRHVGAGVPLLEHGDRRQLRVAQVALEIGIARALRERRLVLAVGEHQPALLAHDDDRAGVLAHGQHAAGRDIGILEEVIGHELVVRARLRIEQDRAQLGQVPGPQQMIDIVEGGLGERAQRLALDHDHLPSHQLLDPDTVGADLAIGRGILAEGKQRGVPVGRDDGGRRVHGEAPVIGSF